MSEQVGVLEVIEEVQQRIREAWPGRFYVDVVAVDFPHRNTTFREVNLRLFRVDMPEDEALELLASCGLPDRDVYRMGYVCQTFDTEQVQALVSYFSDWPIARIIVSPADKPRKNLMGVEAIPVGGSTDNYRFSDDDDYDLPFKVWGHYDVYDCPEWGTGKPDTYSLTEALAAMAGEA